MDISVMINFAQRFTIPDSVKSDKEVKMNCRGTELDAIAKTFKPLVECKARFAFLGMEDLIGGEMAMVAETAESSVITCLELTPWHMT